MGVIFNNVNSTVGSPTVQYTVSVSFGSRTATSVSCTARFTAHMTSSASYLGTGYPLTATLTIGGTSKSGIVLKASTDSWSGTTSHTKTVTFSVALNPETTSLKSTLYVAAKSTSSAGYLKTTSGSTSSINEWTYATIIFDGNTATSGSTASIKKYSGYSVTAPLCGYVKDKYSFVGWNTLASGEGVMYQPNDELTDSLATSSSVTLYAIWEANFKLPMLSGLRAYRVANGVSGENPPVFSSGTRGYCDFTLTGYSINCRVDSITIMFGTEAVSASTGAILDRKYGYSTNSLLGNEQYDVVVTVVGTNTDTGDSSSISFRTYISSEKYAIDINTSGTVVAIGGAATDDSDYFGLQLVDSDLYLDDSTFISDLGDVLNDSNISSSLKGILIKIANRMIELSALSWVELGQQTGTTAFNISTSGYDEVLVFAQTFRSDAWHYTSAVMPVSRLQDTMWELKLSGGQGESGVSTLVQVKISKTQARLASAHINGISYASTTTVFVYGRSSRAINARGGMF